MVRLLGWACAVLAVLVGLGVGPARGQTAPAADPAAPSTQALKGLTLDQLMDVEVTSVSKSPEKLSRRPRRSR